VSYYNIIKYFLPWCIIPHFSSKWILDKKILRV